ncbi:MAG: hypothetical protein H7315_22720 [Herminiimonas sp.]|nr:hypothetical protein [Herminiimonas sp.]
MLNETDIIGKIKTILNARFDIDMASLTDQTKLRDLGIDSLHLVDVMLDLEAELNVTIIDLSLPPETTLGALAASVAQSQAASI